MGWVLGLDVGAASVGWAAVELDDQGAPCALLKAGSHLFEAGTEGTDAKRMQGAEQPRNAARRTARQARRQTWRRWRRKRVLLQTLIGHDLLPVCEVGLRKPEEVDAYMKSLDAGLRPRWVSSHDDQQRWTYRLRAAGVTGELDRHELGRALYQLGQRRGFKSNRRTDARDGEKERSEMKAAIGTLQARIDAHDPPTLGALLASLSPDEERIRARWTSRAMYESEFDRIWDTQSGRLGLGVDAKQAIRRVLFHQRPLRDQRHTIGRCTLISGERRMPVALRAYQTFRVLQGVNHLLVQEPGGPMRSLDGEERAAVLAVLHHEGDCTVARLKKLLRLGKGARFNIEFDEEKRVIGHRTDAKLREVFGDRFDSMSETERDACVTDLRSYRSADGLAKRGRTRWGLSAADAARFAEIALEDDYGSLSAAAVERLLPLMRDGVAYGTARKAVFPESFVTVAAVGLLPPVGAVMEDLRNPGVTRALTEVRKLVNELVRRLGKPDIVRIELGRDLKNPRSLREKMHRANRDREKEREGIAARIVREMGIQRPSREDIERVMLMDECGQTCPYTGRRIEMRDLLGSASQFDVEHIWPRARSLDDSLANKTLCHHEENRQRKGGRTPFEAYGADPERWAAILDRVKQFRGHERAVRAKFARFVAEEIPSDFTERHLNDTRYIGRAMADYVGLLYGGRNDADGKRRIEVCTGGLTAWLRTGWGLADLLDEAGTKNRDDHRHHAVDAVVIALSDTRAVQTLMRAATDADRRRARRAFDGIDEPWDGFRESVKTVIDGVLVTHRQDRRVRGPLHEQTLYRNAGDGKFRVRKELAKLSPAEIRDGRLVDKRALALIRAKLDELGKPDPTPQQLQQIFAVPENAPLVQGADGRMVRLRRVRVDVDAKPSKIGRAGQERYVKPGSNHHTVVWEVTDAKGRVKWEHEVVTMMEAYRRVAAGEPVVNRDGGDGRRFLFSLAQGEHVEMDDPKGVWPRQVWRVRAISGNQIRVTRLHDGCEEAISGKERRTFTGDNLRKLGVRKVALTCLGEVRRTGG